MKKLLIVLMLLPAVVFADTGKRVPFTAHCFNYNDFIKQMEFFEELPIMVGVSDDPKKDTVIISVTYNKQEDTFSVVQFNKEVGCFLTSGKNMKFNLKGLIKQEIK
jgi:hypothetical protein